MGSKSHSIFQDDVHLYDNLKVAVALRKVNAAFKGQLASLRDAGPDPQKPRLVFQLEGYIFSPKKYAALATGSTSFPWIPETVLHL